MDVKSIRRENLKGLIRQHRDSIAELARATDTADRLLSQYKNGTRNIGDRFARKLEAALAKPKGWLDSLQFHSPEDAMNAQEAMQILQTLSEADRDAWLTHGRLLATRGPQGPGNPFGDVPRKPKSGTQ